MTTLEGQLTEKMVFLDESYCFPEGIDLVISTKRSWLGDLKIRDRATKGLVFETEGTAFSFQRKRAMKTVDGTTIGHVSLKMYSLHAQYFIKNAQGLVIAILRKPSNFSTSFELLCWILPEPITLELARDSIILY